MHAVEAVRAAHEVGRALRRAADAADLHHALRLNAHLVHGVDDALGDGVVAAAGAQRRLAAAIVKTVSPMRLVFGRSACSRGRHLDALLVTNSSVMVRASIGSPLKWAMLRSFAHRVGQIEFQQAQHLRVAVLLDHVYAFVRGDEIVDFAGKRIGAKAKIVRLDLVFLSQSDRGSRSRPNPRCRRR